MALRILNPGLMTTVQDLGRYGYAHLGVTPAGAADALALRVANLLLGNRENTAALEMTLLGAAVEFEHAAMIALTGAQVECRLGNARAPMWRAFPVLPGAVLKCGAISGGARAYLAVQGGFALKPVMGSVATLRSAHLGGLEGRALKAGDRLAINHVDSISTRRISRQALAYLEPRLAPASQQRACRGPRSRTAPHGRAAGQVVRLRRTRKLAKRRVHGFGRLRSPRHTLSGKGADASAEVATRHRRHFAGRDAGSSGWATDYFVRGSADDGRLPQDRQCDRGRSAAGCAVASAGCGTLSSSHRRASSRLAAGTGRVASQGI